MKIPAGQAAAQRLGSRFRIASKTLQKKIKKISKKYLQSVGECCIVIKRQANSYDGMNRWPVGQAVKTPPSHGGNRGSIPLLAVHQITGENRNILLYQF